MLKRLILSLLLLTSIQGCFRASLNKSIVMLDGPLARCTAFQVEAPSGRSYLLSAGHCALTMNIQGSYTVKTEDGAILERKLVALDLDADILLLEGVPGMRGFKVASEDFLGEAIRIIGHGWGAPLWEVDGAVIDLSSPVLGPYHLPFQETTMSGQAAPGHSGSPAIDPQGHVVGVVSTAFGGISGIVRLQDLQAFLKGY